jgi:hypothetical protein
MNILLAHWPGSNDQPFGCYVAYPLVRAGRRLVKASLAGASGIAANPFGCVGLPASPQGPRTLGEGGAARAELKDAAGHDKFAMIEM